MNISTAFTSQQKDQAFAIDLTKLQECQEFPPAFSQQQINNNLFVLI